MTKKISKILIANRGEIANRVMRTCDEMGIKTVAIYADNDSTLSYVSEASESYGLGSGELSETYLNIDKIINIVKDSGAEAIHPGYGFLSENSGFRQRCEDEGIVFIGPSSEAMDLMGDKQASKLALEKSGAPLIPGYHGDNQDSEFLKKEAVKIGFPVLIKATAGGGGKGMRIVNNEKDFIEALSGAKSEALKSFSNDNVLLEKFIETPRHIEVQVVGDSHGNVLHFFERECSIQRRYQKIIEETPSPALNDDLRTRICQAGVDIAKSISYENAGTIEFILDSNGDFFFLEMNTRLQVEHPITEMVTGVDLVKLQIQAAQGEKLNLVQSEITQKGHAIECRIYAENADENFMPSVGTIKKMGNSSRQGVRWDASFQEGDEVTINYDPMIGKLVTYANNREACINKMNITLNEMFILGFKTNHNYLLRILKHPKFLAGDIDTLFIEKYGEELKQKTANSVKIAEIIARFELAGTTKNQMTKYEKSNPWTDLGEWRIDS